MKSQTHLPSLNHHLTKLTTHLKTNNPLVRSKIPDRVHIPSGLIVVLAFIAIITSITHLVGPTFSFIRRVAGGPSIRDQWTGASRMLAATFFVCLFGNYFLTSLTFVVGCMEACMQGRCVIVSNIFDLQACMLASRRTDCFIGLMRDVAAGTTRLRLSWTVFWSENVVG